MKRYSLFFWQILLLAIFAVACIFINGWLGFISALLGGTAWVIPNSYFMWKMWRIKAMFNVQRMLNHFLVNEIIKLLLSFGIIALILLTMTIDKKSFFIGYIAMILISFSNFFWYGIKHE